jgi:chromosome segregation ATPase
MLMDIEWQEFSDREIARICDVSNTLVSAIRKELGAVKKETTYTRDGKQQKMKEKNTTIKPEVTEEETFDDNEIEKEIQDAAVANLQKEYEELKDQLTISQAASFDEIEKEKAASVIKDLRAQIRLLEIELKEITISRDTYQRENGELKKQVSSLLKKVKKLEG